MKEIFLVEARMKCISSFSKNADLQPLHYVCVNEMQPWFLKKERKVGSDFP